MNLTEFREKEIWNDGYATGLSKAMSAIEEVEELRQLLRDLCVVVPADYAQLARIADLVKGVDDETPE